MSTIAAYRRDLSRIETLMRVKRKAEGVFSIGLSNLETKRRVLRDLIAECEQEAQPDADGHVEPAVAQQSPIEAGAMS